ncbi:MAG: DUF3791 domain-containing protein [Clostridiales Family XIII bacterium]|jgi:hypothetical protein|nr:DUF3791 domain-containing protein [Clostridiales Family XIII bacterium]
MAINPVLLMQVEIMNQYIERKKLTIQEFLSIDAKYGFLDYIKTGYEPFHLMGDQGILNEIEDYIESNKQASS